MKYQKSQSTSSPIISVSLNAGESIKVQPGAMVYHNGKINLEGKTNGGIGGALVKKMFTGENFFSTTATGTDNGAVIGLAPNGFGDITELTVGEKQYRLNDGVYLACDPTVELSTKSQGLGKAVFGKTGGLFILESSGQGTILINSFGSLMEFDLDGQQELVIDNGHVVCWETNLDYNIERASGIVGFTTGEGLVCRFKGRGKVYLQTRNLANFAAVMSGFAAN